MSSGDENSTSAAGENALAGVDTADIALLLDDSSRTEASSRKDSKTQGEAKTVQPLRLGDVLKTSETRKIESSRRRTRVRSELSRLNAKSAVRAENKAMGVASRSPKKAERALKWHELPEGKLTNDIKTNWKLIRYRDQLNPGKFHKKAVRAIPKHFQVATVHVPAEQFYSSGGTRRQQRGNWAQQFMRDGTSSKLKGRYTQHQQRKGMVSGKAGARAKRRVHKRR
ncbi:MAG: hypothetical protein MHM6MM_001703 [Cercozoa sp. M6MM]